MGNDFPSVSQLHSDLRLFARVVDLIMLRSFISSDSTKQLFERTERKIDNFIMSKPIKMAFIFEKYIWERVLKDWGIFLRNSDSLIMPMAEFLSAQNALFDLVSWDLPEQWMSLMSRNHEEMMEIRDKKRRSEDNLDTLDNDKKPPKKPKDRKQPDGKKPNSPPKKFCLHYLGFLAKVEDLNGNPVSNCDGNARCKSYTHGRLTSDLKEQTKESAKNYFKDSSILSRVQAYINSC